MDGGVVPIVPSAVIFDLPVGGWQCRPTAEFGYRGRRGGGRRRRDRHRRRGRRCAGRRAQGWRRHGVGPARRHRGHRRRRSSRSTRRATSRTRRPDCRGWPIRSPSSDLVAPPAEQIAAFAARDAELSPLNTTIAVVATDALLSQAACRRVAVAAQDGLARTIRPAHTPLDGDTVFALATGAIEVAPASWPELPPRGDVAGDQVGHRRRGRRGGLSGPCGHGRRAGRRVGRRNTDLP